MDTNFSSPAQEMVGANACLAGLATGDDSPDAQRDLDDRIDALFATHTGIGAVLIDRIGHVKHLDSSTAGGNHGLAPAPAVYASIQAAIDAAVDGDAIYIAAGRYREQLTIRGKQLDLLGAIRDDGSSLVTLECPDVASLDVDPIDEDGEFVGECAVVRIKNEAHVTMRHLIIDGRHQGLAPGQSSAHLDFASVSTVGADTVVEYVETRGFETSEAVRLLDDFGRLKGTYSTIQTGIHAAEEGDEVVVAAGLYAEDLYISQRLTLSRATTGPDGLGGEVMILGRVVVAASALDVAIEGIAIDGELEMQPAAGAIASVTLRNASVIGHGRACSERPEQPVTTQRIRRAA